MLYSRSLFLYFLAIALVVSGARAQSTSGTVKGLLKDDSGGIIPAAPVVLTGGGQNKIAQTQADGTFIFNGLAAGEYTLKRDVPGFFPGIATGQCSRRARRGCGHPTLGARRQTGGHRAGEPAASISMEPDNNATALVLRGEDLSALPDDPDDLSDALQALAGPGAGPNGGSILHRWLQRRAASAQGIDPRNPHQPESLFGGVRQAGLRPYRDSYQAGQRQDSAAAWASTIAKACSIRAIRSPPTSPISPAACSAAISAVRWVIAPASSSISSAARSPTTRWSTPSIVDPDYAAANDHPAGRGDAQYAHQHRSAHRLSAVHQSYAGGALRVRLELAREPGHRRLPSASALCQTGVQLHRQQPEPDVDRDVDRESAQSSTKRASSSRRNFSEQIGNLLPQINVAGAFITGGNNMGRSTRATRTMNCRTTLRFSHGAHTFRFGCARAAKAIDHLVARGLRRHVLLRWRIGSGARCQQSTS